jgi:excisionase family DNA binding protein
MNALLTDEELREFLGISRTTLWRLRKSGGLPFGKVGRSYRYRVSEILRWVGENPQSSGQLALGLERSAH